MDLGTLIGIVAGFGLVVTAMALGGPPTAFLNAPGFIIVLGGTLAATLINERLQHVLSAFRVVANAFRDRSVETGALIPLILELAAKARKEGLVSLEGEQIDDEFVSRGLRLGIDGLSPEAVRATLLTEIAALKSRHQRGQKILRFMGGTAPSMGLVGTLIGLVQMLRALDDPSAIGPAMAVALLTTLYGALLAFLLFLPLAEKLQKRSQEEVENKQLALAGIDSILRGENSLLIKAKLEGFVAPRDRRAQEDS